MQDRNLKGSKRDNKPYTKSYQLKINFKRNLNKSFIHHYAH